MARVRITTPVSSLEDTGLKLQHILDDTLIVDTAGTSSEPLITTYLSYLDGLCTEKTV